MGKCFLYGNGGGAPLNFKVVRYDSKADLPETAKDNTIAVFTDVDIDGWHFGAKQPEEMRQGMVWFPTSTFSPVEFNALKKNGVEVYPSSARQYVDGALVAVEAKTYIKGKWRDWRKFLLDANGFTVDVVTYLERAGVTLDYYSNGDGLTIVHGGNGAIFIYSAEKIDLTEINTMRIKAGPIGSAMYVGIIKQNKNMVSWWNGVDALAVKDVKSNSEVTLDLSSISGSYYLAISTLYGGTFYLEEIELE